MLLIAIVCLVFMSLPFWLPSLFIWLRELVFTKINGEKSIHLPNEQLDDKCFRSLYENPHLRGKSQGAALSDLFWYWLSPGAYIHQEHLEDGEDYEKLAGFTKEKLAIPRAKIEKMITQCFEHVHLLGDNESCRTLRFRDYMIPLWAEFYYELIFEEPCSLKAKQLITNHATDVVTALKCCGLRHMKKRYALTDFLREKLQRGIVNGKPLLPSFPEGFSLDDQAYFLQGVFFNTAVVQMSDAMCHLVMTLAKHLSLQDVMANSGGDKILYQNMINETLRLFPLFGIAHRISTEEIIIHDRVISKGSVVCFNYSAFQKKGFEHPELFQPDRWNQCPVQHEHFIPFGVMKNRMCPAQGVAIMSIRKSLEILLDRYHFETSAIQTRSLINRAPVIVSRRNQKVIKYHALKRFKMILIDRWESVYLSILQLVYGIIMLVQAKKHRLATRYFADKNKKI